MSYEYPTSSYTSTPSASSWFDTDFITRIAGFSFFASLLQGSPLAGLVGSGGGLGSFLGGGNGIPQTDGTNAAGGGEYAYLWKSASLFFFGLIIETGRRFCIWLIERVRFQYTITAQFSEVDPAYEWLILFLTDAQVWKSSREFHVSAASSTRKWGVKPSPDPTNPPSSGSSLRSFFSRSSLQSFYASLPLIGDTAKIASVHVEEKNKRKGFDVNGEAVILYAPDREDGTPHAEYVPTYEAPQLFRWKGYWVEIKRNNGRMMFNPIMGHQQAAAMYLTIYTHDLNVLSSFVEEAREGYVKSNRPHVIVHTADQPIFGPVFTWSNAKSKARRPLSSIILQEGIINSLVADVREFLETEDWYFNAGIPHRRGYLLYGPPGTGKTSTIYAIAGELGLEIFSLSLASTFVDDSFLQRAVAAVPKHAIFLIEDIDCAFPLPRDAAHDFADDNAYQNMFPGGPMAMGPHTMMAGPMGPMGPMGGAAGRTRSLVTLSGLLNVIDGVGSEEGKIFFATTNHVDHLDPALMRPGRIDKKIQYKLATQAQAEALFLRFYPEEILKSELERSASTAPSEKPPVEEPASSTTPSEKRSEPSSSSSSPSLSTPIEKPSSTSTSETSSLSTHLTTLANDFSSSIPAHEFSTAELQGYLLSCKTSPMLAVRGVKAWVDDEEKERKAKKEREEGRRRERAKEMERREERETERLRDRLGLGAGGAVGAGVVPPTVASSLPVTVPSTVAGPMVGATSAAAGAVAGAADVTVGGSEAAAVGPPPVNGSESSSMVIVPPPQNGVDTPVVDQKVLVNGVQ